MAQEIQKPTKLAICGKIVNIEKILSKSKAQFINQLRFVGIDLPEDELGVLYDRLITDRTPKEEYSAEKKQGGKNHENH